MNNIHLQKLKISYNQLEKALLNLKPLPLSIIGVKCTSGYYRRTKPVPNHGLMTMHKNNVHIVKDVALPDDCGDFLPFLPSVKILITLERSGKWGNDLSMIGKLKSIFYVDISRRLKINEKWFSVPKEDQLLIVVNKIVFSIKIVHQKEISLLLQCEGDAPVKKGNSQQIRWKKNSSMLLRKKFIHKPLISTQIYGLCQRFPAFGPTCVYVRQWLSYNYLSKMFEGMAIELLVAHLFVHETSVPLSGLAGFARFIAFLASFDFVLQPVIVDINNSFLPQSIEKAKDEFIKRRAVLPPLVIITPEDIAGTFFTNIKPESIVFLRTIKLAAATHEHICSTALKENTFTEFEFPIHDLSIYDFVIHLNKKFLTVKEKIVIPKNKREPFQKPASFYLPSVDFDPVKVFVQTLRNNFDSLGLFFYNNYKPEFIGVLLRPTFLAPRDSKIINNCHSRIKNDNNLNANLEALIQDFELLGGPLVLDVVPSDKHKCLIKT